MSTGFSDRLTRRRIKSLSNYHDSDVPLHQKLKIARPILYINGVVTNIEQGTTLGDLRKLYPTAFVQYHNDHSTRFTNNKLILQDGVAYDLVEEGCYIVLIKWLRSLFS